MKEWEPEIRMGDSIFHGNNSALFCVLDFNRFFALRVKWFIREEITTHYFISLSGLIYSHSSFESVFSCNFSASPCFRPLDKLGFGLSSAQVPLEVDLYTSQLCKTQMSVNPLVATFVISDLSALALFAFVTVSFSLTVPLHKTVPLRWGFCFNGCREQECVSPGSVIKTWSVKKGVSRSCWEDFT